MALSSLLPRLIQSQAKPFEQRRGQDFRTLSDLTDKIESIEKLLNQYKLDFPFFVEIGSSEIPVEEDDIQLWAFERMGWGKFQGQFQLLYVLEGLPIPKMPDAEVVGIHCLTPPPLDIADEFRDHSPLMAEEIRAVPLKTSPPEVKEGCYSFIPEFLLDMSDTIIQMTRHEKEFENFLNQKIQEAIDESGLRDSPDKIEEIEKYFRFDRRQEFFDQFLYGEVESSQG